jgi:cell shape-determining protein MreC
LPLVLTWLVGGGLLAAPQPVGDALRAAVRDAACPGQQGVRSLAHWVQSVAAVLRQPTASDEEFVRLTGELQAWRQRCLRYQTLSARLQQEVEQARRGSGPPFNASPGEPLFVPKLLEAKVLGTEREPLQRDVRRILDRGSVDGIAVDDLVLEDGRPHLDQGAASGVTADMPVYSGRRVVGRIQQAGWWTSTLQRVTDAEYRGFAQLVRESPEGPVFGAHGVLAGNGNGTCRLELVAATDPVSVGDYVYTVPQRTGVPEPLCYGRIVQADLVEGAAHWTITVAPAIGDESLQAVQVLREVMNPTRWAAAEEERK